MLARSVHMAASLVSMSSVTALAAVGRPATVVFLNPGESLEGDTGPHWQLVSRFMNATAERLGMRLEVLYAERDHLLMQRQAESIAARADAPDYVVIVNEKMAAQPMLQTLSHSPAKILLIHNDLTEAQRSITGNERGTIQNWIGTITADAERGSFRLMQYLASLIRDQPARVIGITGDRATPVSAERAAGVRSALARDPQNQMYQLAFGDWSFADGREKASVLLSRYPDVNILWAANDSMTLGALSAVRERHSNVIVGGLGALPEAVESVARNELAAIVAGDLFIGACAMVLIYDYHHGADFAQAGGARQRLDFLKVLHGDDAARFQDIAFERPMPPDFRTFSRVLRRTTAPYGFDLQVLLDASSRTA